MITYYVHQSGSTQQAETIDPAWLQPGSQATIWADVRQPTPEDAEQLRRTFNFHELSLADAISTSQYPKIESFGAYIYVVLHGIDFTASQHAFETMDTDFFLGGNYLVTVHDGRRRSIAEIHDLCGRSGFVLSEGPAALMHRIVDRMVDHYRPELDELEQWLDEIESRVIEAGSTALTAEILGVKRDISSMRRVLVPQRDVVARLARREFDMIDQEVAYRFRDAHDHLVRFVDDTMIFQDRVTGILDAHLASVSNQLALVSKVLAGIAVIFGPLTVVTGLFGMNVRLPALPGGEAAQFWWITGIMAVITAGLYGVFKRQGWL